MKATITPIVARIVTVSMTETEAQDLLDRFNRQYTPLKTAFTISPGEAAMRDLLVAIEKGLQGR